MSGELIRMRSPRLLPPTTAPRRSTRDAFLARLDRALVRDSIVRRAVGLLVADAVERRGEGAAALHVLFPDLVCPLCYELHDDPACRGRAVADRAARES